MTDTYVKIQVVGKPDDCIEQISRLRRLTGMDHLVREFAYAGIPHEEAEQTMRLFADKVLPVLQRDPHFTRPAQIVTELPPLTEEGVFAPA